VKMKNNKERQIGLGYLLELATGHYRSKVLFVASNLKIFTILSNQARTLEEIRTELNIEYRPASMLLNACVALNLLEKKEGVYCNSRTAETYLVAGKPQYLEPAFFKFDEHSYLLFDQLEKAILSDSAQISVTNPEDPELLPSCMLIGNRDEYRKFLSALDPIAEWPANVIASSFDFSRFKKLIDIGAGSGVYSAAIVKKHANIEAIAFDLPYPSDVGEEMVRERGLSDRIKYHRGDYFKEDFPQGFDVALLSNVLHGYGPDKCTFLLKKVYDSLPSGGAIIISDLILDEDGCGPEIAVLMSFYFLLITEAGRNYTLSEYETMLTNAGFLEIGSTRSSGETRFITGIKKGP
jgi:SAM-dependent methyltransferase